MRAVTWHGFTIVCVDVDEDSEFDDQRAITRLGFLAPKLKIEDIDKAWAIQQSRGNHVCIEIDGVPVNPVSDKEDNVKYLRTTEELSTDDPLLDLPSISVYRAEERLDQIQ